MKHLHHHNSTSKRVDGVPAPSQPLDAARLVATLLALVALLLPAASLVAQDHPTPDVELREIHVRKNEPDEVFHHAGTTVTLWVKDDAGEFESVLWNESEITTFRDSTGRDLSAAHEDEVLAWREKVNRLREEGRFVSMGRTRDLYQAEALDRDEGVSGFYLNVDSWALPAPEAEWLELAGTFTYVVATDARRTELFEEINLLDTKIVRLGEWGIRPTDFNESDGTLTFTLSSDLPIARFTVRSLDGEVVGGIVYTMNGDPVVEMPDELFDASVELEVQFFEPLRRRVEIERRVRVGL